MKTTQLVIAMQNETSEVINSIGGHSWFREIMSFVIEKSKGFFANEKTYHLSNLTIEQIADQITETFSEEKINFCKGIYAKKS